MNVIDTILNELTNKSKSGILDFTDPNILKLLRESLQDKGIPENLIKEVLNSVLSNVASDRIAYNENGYAVLFESEQDKNFSVENGETSVKAPQEQNLQDVPNNKAPTPPSPEVVPKNPKIDNNPTKFDYKNDNPVGKDVSNLEKLPTDPEPEVKKEKGSLPKGIDIEEKPDNSTPEEITQQSSDTTNPEEK